jgi:hypothetical protein
LPDDATDLSVEMTHRQLGDDGCCIVRVVAPQADAKTTLVVTAVKLRAIRVLPTISWVTLGLGTDIRLWVGIRDPVVVDWDQG